MQYELLGLKLRNIFVELTQYRVCILAVFHCPQYAYLIDVTFDIEVIMFHGLV